MRRRLPPPPDDPVSSRPLRLLPSRRRPLGRFSGVLGGRWLAIGRGADLSGRLGLPLPRPVCLCGLAVPSPARNSWRALLPGRSRPVLRRAPGRDRGLGRSHGVTKVRERRRDRLDVLALHRLVERRPRNLKAGGLGLTQVARHRCGPGSQGRGLGGGVAPDPGERQGPRDGGALIRCRHRGRLEGPSPRSGGVRVRLSQEGGHLGVGQWGVGQDLAPAQAGEADEQEANGCPTWGTE